MPWGAMSAADNLELRVTEMRNAAAALNAQHPCGVPTSVLYAVVAFFALFCESFTVVLVL